MCLLSSIWMQIIFLGLSTNETEQLPAGLWEGKLVIDNTISPIASSEYHLSIKHYSFSYIVQTTSKPISIFFCFVLTKLERWKVRRELKNSEYFCRIFKMYFSHFTIRSHLAVTRMCPPKWASFYAKAPSSSIRNIFKFARCLRRTLRAWVLELGPSMMGGPSDFSCFSASLLLNWMAYPLHLHCTLLVILNW